MKKFTVIWVILLSLIVIGCDNESTPIKKVVTEKTQNKTKNYEEKLHDYNTILQSQHVAINQNGKTSSIYKKDNKLVYNDSGQEVPLNKTAPARRFWLKISGKYIYVFWWVKFNTTEEDSQTAGKTLYVNVSQDHGKTFSDPVRVNNDHGVLPDLHIITDDKGHITIAYLDERYKGHQIFSNSSQDGGKTWLKNDIQLNQVLSDADEFKKLKLSETKISTAAVTPRLEEVDGQLVAIWEQIETYNGKTGVSVVSRTSKDFGQTWGASKVIHRDFEHLSIELYSTSTNDEVYLFAVLDKGTVVFVRKNAEFEKIDGFVPGSTKDRTQLISYFKTAFDADNLYLTYISVKGNRKEDNHVEFQVFNKKQKKWKENGYRFDLLKGPAKSLSRSYFQDICILQDGVLVVAFEDYRGILPSVLMNYSLDHGKTWLKVPLPLNKVGYESASFPFIKSSSNAYYVFFKNLVLSNAIKPVITTKSVFLPSPKALEFKDIDFPKLTVPSESKSRSILKNRVTELMKLRLQKSRVNMEKEWEYFDPIFKTNNRQLVWMSKRDMIDFVDYKIEQIYVKGVTAEVIIKLTHKMNERFPPAKTNKKVLEKKTESAPIKWGWFYDNWYLISDNPRQSYLP